MNKVLILCLFGFGMIALSAFNPADLPTDRNMSELLIELGEPKPKHYIAAINPEAVKRGEELVKFGKTIGPNGEKSGYISKYFKCTSCHNTVREDLDLSTVNQDERLNFAIQNNLPYLPASTLWGMVNKETWYNDDYVKKYGDLVKPANHDLKEAIQLCAVECSQGKALNEWEMESVVHYLWSLQMKVSDLGLLPDEQEKLEDEEASSKEKIALLKSKYMQKSPATFVDAPTNKKKGYDYEGRPELGKAIYALACQHCHRPNGESDVVLDNAKTTFKWLKKHMNNNDQLSFYQAIRYGTWADAGHREYMPRYTKEKMSDQQVEDLRAYIESQIK